MVTGVPSDTCIFQFPHLCLLARPHPAALGAEVLGIENRAELTGPAHNEMQWVPQ